jgi:gas vesicle protein
MEVMTMNDATDSRGTQNLGSTLVGFALGAVVGAGVALLMAPDSGKKTRARLASTARRLGENAEHTVEQARETVAELGADARSAIRAGQEAFLHDRSIRRSHSEHRMSYAGSTADGDSAVGRSSEPPTR